ncbi:MAG: fructosamine kinase family protein [Saprospiraceae bacterium]|nr:fructosamine kinase family protein [Saprospiraceae bacterium]
MQQALPRCLIQRQTTTCYLPPSCKNALKILGADIRSIRPVTGGDINQALLLDTSAGQFFLKTNTAPTAASMFEAEAAGLALLASANAIRTPTVIGLATPQKVDSCCWSTSKRTSDH